jgi:hypothetical protein
MNGPIQTQGFKLQNITFGGQEGALLSRNVSPIVLAATLDIPNASILCCHSVMLRIQESGKRSNFIKPVTRQQIYCPIPIHIHFFMHLSFQRQRINDFTANLASQQLSLLDHRRQHGLDY